MVAKSSNARIGAWWNFQVEAGRWKFRRAASDSRWISLAVFGLLAWPVTPAHAQIVPYSSASLAPAPVDDFTLARKLRNPVASLVNLPLVDNLDFGGGPDHDGVRNSLNLEPIVPFELSARWKLVSRLTLPIIDQRNVVPGTSQNGLGDTVERLLLSPSKSNAQGMNYGFGPAFLLPTATNDLLGYDRWGVGPAMALNWHSGGWVASVLAYQLFSVAGSGTHTINTMTIQPSVSYIFPTDTTLTLSSDSVYDWRSTQYTCPVNLTVYQLTKWGDQPVNIGGGVRYYVDRPSGAAQWGLRFSVTFIFPTTKP